MNKKQIWAIVAILVVIAAIVGTVVATSGDDPKTSSNSEQSASEMGMTETEHDNMDKNSQSSSSQNGSSEAEQTNSVAITDFAYSPATITVKVGTTVTWTNNDTARHDVMSDDSSPDAPSSELLAKGESYSFTFKKAGTYSYHCTPHPYMKGKVIVTE